MPTASPYQHVFRVNKPAENNNGNGVQVQNSRVRRNRQPLSCDACRARKLKCDRQCPCSPCSKRGDRVPTSCSYSKVEKYGGRSPPAAKSTRSEAQLRLQKLEELVTDLMQRAPSSGASDVSSNSMAVGKRMTEATISSKSSSEQIESVSNGHLATNGLERHYHGATHWTTILENIQDIRGLVGSVADPPDEFPSSQLPETYDIALATTQWLKMDDFLDALPPRAATDNLVSTYLSSDSIRAPHIHSQKFLREYRAFWDDPYSTSLLWVSILFSVLWTSSYLGSSKSESATSSTNVAFFTKAGQALVAGGYHKARPYSADATLSYALCSFYVSKQDGDTNCWLMMGIATRLAVKMGYHRDPKHLSHISPFEGEMRRRCFFMLEAFDVLLSNQFGLPAILQEGDCDTETPRNLRDEDFDENCRVLPPSRPSADATPMLYYCYKSRFAKAHKRAIRHALALETTSYDATLKLDAELRANDADVPASLQMASLDELLLDLPWQTLRRMHIKFQYLRSLCVLHRKYLNLGRTNPHFAYSRKVCIGASLELLKYQSDIYFATRPGGRFCENQPMLIFLTQHHFLLPTMMICLDLYECNDQQALLSSEDLKAQALKHDALRLSHDVWISRSNFSRDAQRASNIVANILSKVPRPNVPTVPADDVSKMQMHPSPHILDNLSNPTTTFAIHPFSNAKNPQLWIRPPIVEDSSVLPFDASDPINLIFDGTENIDWDGLDQYLVDGQCGTIESLDWQMPEVSDTANLI